MNNARKAHYEDISRSVSFLYAQNMENELDFITKFIEIGFSPCEAFFTYHDLKRRGFTDKEVEEYIRVGRV